MGLLPKQSVLEMDQDRGTGRVRQGGGGVDVVVVSVRADDGLEPPVPDGLGDGSGIVCRVYDDHFFVIAHDPDIVVHLPCAAVQTEGAGRDEVLDARAAARHRVTTERSTSPLCIRAKASSTSSRAMVSDTNASRSRRP